MAAGALPGFSDRGSEGFFAPLRGAPLNARRRAAALRRSRAARFSRVSPRRRFWICRAASGEAYFAPLWGAPKVPPAAAGIAGSRPGGRADFLRAQEVGGRRALKGTSASPLENPPGVPCHNPQVTVTPHGYTSCRHNSGCGCSQRLRPDSSPKPHGGKQRPFRAFARSARVRGKAARFSASPWALRASQKPPCLPECTFGTVPETLGQRHCARGAAAGGMLHTRPFIRGRAPPTLAEGQPEAARGSRGSPLAASFPHFLSVQEMGPPAGAGPGSSAAR